MSTASDRRQAVSQYENGRVVAERYEILATIGQGASGTVYRARDLYVDSSDEIVALKAIHPHLHGDKQIFGRFRREVEILRRLRGPNLCQLLDCIEEDGLLLISIEHVDGPPLDDYLHENQPLPLAEVAAIMGQVCSALTVAHDSDVIHRDLKPSNILIQGVSAPPGSDVEGKPRSFLRELKVRVVDFGLAKMVAGDMTGTALTEVDMIFGTPDYMSPEQVAGEELDKRTDIYSAGVMLYEMVVGTVPFVTPGPLTTMAAHLNQPTPSPRAAAPERDISPRLERCIMKALSKSPADRHASAAELGRALTDALTEALDDRIADGEVQSDTDTALDQDKSALSTTLQSQKNAALEAAKAKGGKVRVVIRESVPSTNPPSKPPVSSQRHQLTVQEGERQIWTVAAVVVVLAALAIGVWLGVRG